MLKERRHRHKPGAALIDSIVSLWEKARPADLSSADRRRHVSALAVAANPHILSLAVNHSGARAVQLILKHGSPAERAAVAHALTEHATDLARQRHGSFCLRRLAAGATKEEAKALARALRGRVPRLLSHPSGHAVLDDLWSRLDAVDRDGMAAEFYAPGVAMAAAPSGGAAPRPPKSLDAFLASTTDPAARRRAMTTLAQRALPLAEKRLLDAALSHRVLREYVDRATPLEVYDVAEGLSGPQLLRTAHTRDGAALACCSVSAGTAKDRKRCVKAMRGHVSRLLEDEWGHTLVLTALTVVDDTRLLRTELGPELIAACRDRDREEGEGDGKEGGEALLLRGTHARRVPLQLLAPDRPRWTPAWLVRWIRPEERRVNEAAAIDAHSRKLASEHKDALASGKVPHVDLPRGGTRGEHEGEGDDDDDDDDASGSDADADDTGSDIGSDDGSDEDEAPHDDGKILSRSDRMALSTASNDDDASDPDSDSKDHPTAEEGGGWRVGAIHVRRKADDVRRREVLAGGLGEALTQRVEASAGALLECKNGCDVAVELARGGDNGVLGEERAARCRAAVAAALAEKDSARLGGWHASRALRRLAEDARGGEQRPPCPGARAACDEVWQTAVKGRAAALSGGHAAKVVAALALAGGETGDAVRAELEAAGAAGVTARGGASVDAWLATFADRRGEKQGREGPVPVAAGPAPRPGLGGKTPAATPATRKRGWGGGGDDATPAPPSSGPPARRTRAALAAKGANKA